MGKPPFPTSETLIAPPSWRCIDFISDLHLHEDLPKTTAALAHYLDTTHADAVFLLGDIFEAWVGDDMRTQPYEQRCADMFAKASQRTRLFMMVGNRDFLLGPDMVAACGAQHLPDPTVLSAFGQRALLMHGDELCLADEAYLRFRAQVRQPAWQQAFLAAPLTARLAQAQHMRNASQMHQKTQAPEQWADVDEVIAGQWMAAAHAPTLIHGHTHHPQTQCFGSAQVANGVRHVLSDWDLDHAHPRAEVLRWTAEGFVRVSWR